MKENKTMEPQAVGKPKPALFALRAVIAFLLLGVLLGVLYWWGYNAYPSVAEWVTPGDHSAFVYEGETYYRSGVIGKKGLTLKKYPIEEILGKVKDDGVPVTEPETTEEEMTVPPPYPQEPETFEEESLPESVEPPFGAELFDRKDHAYILYSVKEKPDFLLLLEADGEYYLYYREGTHNPLAPASGDE